MRLFPDGAHVEGEPDSWNRGEQRKHEWIGEPMRKRELLAVVQPDEGIEECINAQCIFITKKATNDRHISYY